jgi:hypothetical protein
MSSLLPPGLAFSTTVEHACSGGSGEWREILSTKLYTNAFVFDGNKVLAIYRVNLRLEYHRYLTHSCRFFSATRNADLGKACAWWHVFICEIELTKARWNGFGGKVEQGETSLQAATRELLVRSLNSSWRGLQLSEQSGLGRVRCPCATRTCRNTSLHCRRTTTRLLHRLLSRRRVFRNSCRVCVVTCSFTGVSLIHGLLIG